jgi:hypothetical protein
MAIPGWVYVLSNKGFSDLVKIGFTAVELRDY